MAHQTPLFYESIHDAIRELVRVLGGAKPVGHLLWPGKSMQDAQTRLLNCLDHNRPEKLSPEDLALLLKKGREAGCHVLMTYINAECGYTAPEPIDPVDEQARIVDTIREASAVLKAATERLDRLTVAPIRAVK